MANITGDHFPFQNRTKQMSKILFCLTSQVQFQQQWFKKMQRKFSNNKLQEKEYLCLLALLFCLEHNLS